jgi:hypothetical protein
MSAFPYTSYDDLCYLIPGASFVSRCATFPSPILVIPCDSDRRRRASFRPAARRCQRQRRTVTVRSLRPGGRGSRGPRARALRPLRRGHGTIRARASEADTGTVTVTHAEWQPQRAGSRRRALSRCGRPAAA